MDIAFLLGIVALWAVTMLLVAGFDRLENPWEHGHDQPERPLWFWWCERCAFVGVPGLCPVFC